MTIDFDYLILVPGVSHSYFGHDNWEKYAPGLKTITDALKIRERILLSFERAEMTQDAAKQKGVSHLCCRWRRPHRGRDGGSDRRKIGCKT